MDMPKKMLTIAGSDILAGGGIQADLATFNEYGYFGLSVISSIVTVTDEDFTIHPVPLDVFEKQLAAIGQVDDFAGIKVGLLPSEEHIVATARFLKPYVGVVPIVVDPVMAFKEAGAGTMTDMRAAYITHLLPLATLITPNLVEAEWLLGRKISSEADLKQAAADLKGFGPQNVVVKGGARLNGTEALDALFADNDTTVFRGPKITTVFNNGAGCTFASGIAANLANGLTAKAAVADAKDFVRAGIANGVALNADFNVGNVWQAARRLEEHHES
jgi:pyridoxine kinase